MSHFVVVVIGEDVDEQLAPYDENIPGDEPELRYIQARDVEKMIEYFTEQDGVRPSPDELLSKFHSYWGGVEEEGWEPFFEADRIGYYSWYNQNAKWDWYQVGGRWRGFWMLKPSAEGGLGSPSWANEEVPPSEYTGKADYALKKNIDFKAMRNNSEKRANEYFDKLDKVVAESGLTQGDIKGFMPWDAFRLRFKNIDTARNKYPLQPLVAAFREAAKEDKSLISWLSAGPEDILAKGREAYVEWQTSTTDVPFAIVKEGEWIERGEMGWWGVVTDEKEVSEWSDIVHKIYDELDDDTLLTAVDCHI